MNYQNVGGMHCRLEEMQENLILLFLVKMQKESLQYNVRAYVENPLPFRKKSS